MKYKIVKNSNNGLVDESNNVTIREIWNSCLQSELCKHTCYTNDSWSFTTHKNKLLNESSYSIKSLYYWKHFLYMYIHIGFFGNLFN